MRLSNGMGIGCDQCGATHQNEFTYYAVEARRVELKEGRRPPTDVIMQSPITHPFDVCSSCFESIKQRLVACPPQRGLYCELSGVPLTTSLYFLMVSRVQVEFRGQPYKCVKCGKVAATKDKACACGGTRFARDAKTAVEARFVEFSIAEEQFQKMAANEEKVKQIAGQWTTTT
jgi:hypothetical protein